LSTFGDNKLHPLEIEDARLAAFKASELQKDVETKLKRASADLANKERVYRRALTIRMLELKSDSVAVTACETIAKGEESIAQLRYDRDVARGALKAVAQQAFRRGADRKDINLLLEWSMKRDLRTDTPPPDGGAGLRAVG
jgi:hypothetical protein